MQVRNLDRPASPSCYAVAGRLLFVESDNLQLTQLLDTLFAGWQLARSDFSQQRAQVHISCHCHTPFPAIPPGNDQFEIAEQAKCYIGDDGLFLDLGNSLLRLKSRNPVEIDLWFKLTPDSVNANLARTLSFAVCAGLRRYGMFELHGAGLLGPDHKSGVVIIGPSGSGKSTLTTHLVASGWGYLSDDELLLTLENNLVIARGFRSFFALSPMAIEASGLTLAAVAAEPGSKACFEPVDVFGRGRVDSAVPRTLFFTSVGEQAETQISELSRIEVMRRLLTACPWATYDREVAKENLHVLSRLANQSKGFALNAGRDLLTPNYADALLKTYIVL